MVSSGFILSAYFLTVVNNRGVFSHAESTITTCGFIFTGHAHCNSCHQVPCSFVLAVSKVTCLTATLLFHSFGSPSALVFVSSIVASSEMFQNALLSFCCGFMWGGLYLALEHHCVLVSCSVVLCSDLFFLFRCFHLVTLDPQETSCSGWMEHAT